jgi:hypothetical protein
MLHRKDAAHACSAWVDEPSNLSRSLDILKQPATRVSSIYKHMYVDTLHTYEFFILYWWLHRRCGDPYHIGEMFTLVLLKLTAL